MMYVVLRSSGLYRAAFLFIHLIAKNQMKQSIQAISTPVPMSVKAGKILSWRTIAKLLTFMSFGLLECDNRNDVIGYVKVLILLMSAFVLAGLEGGAL